MFPLPFGDDLRCNVRQKVEIFLFGKMFHTDQFVEPLWHRKGGQRLESVDIKQVHKSDYKRVRSRTIVVSVGFRSERSRGNGIDSEARHHLLGGHHAVSIGDQFVEVAHQPVHTSVHQHMHLT